MLQRDLLCTLFLFLVALSLSSAISSIKNSTQLETTTVQPVTTTTKPKVKAARVLKDDEEGLPQEDTMDDKTTDDDELMARMGQCRNTCQRRCAFQGVMRCRNICHNRCLVGDEENDEANGTDTTTVASGSGNSTGVDTDANPANATTTANVNATITDVPTRKPSKQRASQFIWIVSPRGPSRLNRRKKSQTFLIVDGGEGWETNTDQDSIFF